MSWAAPCTRAEAFGTGLKLLLRKLYCKEVGNLQGAYSIVTMFQHDQETMCLIEGLGNSDAPLTLEMFLEYKPG